MGCAAVTRVVAYPKRCFIIYMLEDNQGNFGSRHAILFPPGLRGRASVCTIPVGNLPTGQLLLANPRAKILGQDSGSFTPVYAYVTIMRNRSLRGFLLENSQSRWVFQGFVYVIVMVRRCVNCI